MNVPLKMKKKMNLKKKILFEYIYVVLTILLLYFLTPYLVDIMIDGNLGIDGIAQALVGAMIVNIIRYVITFIIFVIIPIRIIIVYKDDFKKISPKIKRLCVYFFVILPILFGFLIIFENSIGDLAFKLKYKTGKNAYKLTEEGYKSPKDFQNELKNRGFFYNSDTELSILNSKYEHYSEKYSKYFYENASLMTLSSENEQFYDSKDYNEVISFDSKKKAPGYIYNTILYLYDRNGELKYAPISRYEEHNYISMKPYPFFEDYYIELKILYVNEDIYAIIGVGQGYDIDKYFEEYRKKHNIFYTNPYNMILSEKDSITTYYKGKYYPNGLIINRGDRFQMSPSTNKLNYLEYYKIRKVDKLNVETVNKIAKELQNNVLKDSIKYHFDKRSNKNNQP